MKILIILSVSVLTIFASQFTARAQDDAKVFAEVDFSNDTVTLSDEAKQQLGDLKLDDAKGLALAEAIEAYQKRNSEALGVELGLDLNGQITLSSNSNLSANQLAISSAFLEQYKDPLSTDLSSTPTVAEIEALLNERTQGVGGLTVGEIAILHQAGIHRTVHPIFVQVVSLQLDSLRTQICQNEDGQNEDGTCIIGAFEIAYDAIINTFTWQQQNNEDGPAELQACADAYKAFIPVEDKAAKLGTDQSWRDPNDPEHSSIAPFAKDFDTECLSPLSGLGANSSVISSRMAALRMPNDKTPFCSAFEIRAGVYLTAQHCFHNRQDGSVLFDRLHNGVIVEYDDPDKEIGIDQSRAPSIQSRTGSQLTRVERQIPGEDDVVLIFADNQADQPALNDFPAADPIIGSELVVPGYFQFATLAPGERVSRASWADQLRYTKPITQDYCRSYDVAKQSDESGCLIHRCQTVAGFSGSPIFQKDGSDLVLIGVHSGAQVEVEHHCTGDFTLGGATGNSAIPLVGGGNIGSLINDARLIRLGRDR